MFKRVLTWISFSQEKDNYKTDWIKLKFKWNFKKVNNLNQIFSGDKYMHLTDCLKKQ